MGVSRLRTGLALGVGRLPLVPEAGVPRRSRRLGNRCGSPRTEGLTARALPRFLETFGASRGRETAARTWVVRSDL
jgi:hypothetical protein